MNNLSKSFFYALIIGLLVHALGFIVNLSFFKSSLDDIKRIIAITASIFFLAPFFSFLFYKKERKLFIKLLLPSTLAFIITYIVVILSFLFIVEVSDIDFFNITSFFNGIIAFFTSLFFTLMQALRDKKIQSRVVTNVSFNYSQLFVFLIPLSGTFIYALILALSYRNFFSSAIHRNSINYLLLSGFLVGIVAFYGFSFIYRKAYSLNRRALIIGFYFFVLFLITFLETKFSSNPNSIVATSIRLPYYLYVLIFTQFFFIRKLSKIETKYLEEQKLISDINFLKLKSQLSPHFLFNNINVLTSLIEENPQKAVIFSNKLSSIYRHFLENEKQDIIKLEDEISFAKDYLDLFKTRYEGGINYKFNILKEDNYKFIVATTLQQVLENVVKHNEISIEKEVIISVFSKDNYLNIENNKNVLIAKPISQKRGIDSIIKRYKFYTEDEVIIEETEEKYLIKVPLLNN